MDKLYGIGVSKLLEMGAKFEGVVRVEPCRRLPHEQVQWQFYNEAGKGDGCFDLEMTRPPLGVWLTMPGDGKVAGWMKTGPEFTVKRRDGSEAKVGRMRVVNWAGVLSQNPTLDIRCDYWPEDNGVNAGLSDPREEKSDGRSQAGTQQRELPSKADKPGISTGHPTNEWRPAPLPVKAKPRDRWAGYEVTRWSSQPYSPERDTSLDHLEPRAVRWGAEE